MQTSVDTAEESTPAWLLRVCCDVGPKQCAWGTVLILTLLLSLAAGAYSALEEDEAAERAESNFTICDGDGDFTQDEQIALQTVVILGAVLSMLGSSFIMFSYFWFPDLQTFPYKLIMFLSLADFFASSEYLLAIQDVGVTTEDSECYQNTFMCYFSAGLTQYFDMASFLWMAVISYNIYQVLVNRRGHDVVKLEKWYHVVCWGVPAILAVIVTATGSLGDSGNWCWIKQDHQIERWLCYYVILIMIMIFNVATYYITSGVLKQQGGAHQKALTQRMMMYVGVFLFIRFWSVLNRFVELIVGNHGVYPLMFLHSLFSPLQGFANAIVYGFNRKIKNHYRALCCGSDARQVVETDNPAGEDQGDDGDLYEAPSAEAKATGGGGDQL